MKKTAQRSRPQVEKDAIPAPDNTVAGQHLQKTLSEFLHLQLLFKQAHWNLRGPHFRSLHLQFDETVDLLIKHGDEVAERLRALGLPANGQPARVASEAELPELDEGLISDTQALEGVIVGLDETCRRLRTRIDDEDALDPISQDLLIAAGGELEKQLWMYRSSRGA